MKALITVFSIIFLLSCYHEEDGVGSNPANWEVALKLEDKFGQSADTFAQGERVNMKLSITNHADKPRTLNFSSSQQYDLEVFNAQGDRVWRWSDGQMFMQALTERTLSPGETHRIEESWDQTSSADGDAVPVGEYSVEGRFLGVDQTADESLTIR